LRASCDRPPSPLKGGTGSSPISASHPGGRPWERGQVGPGLVNDLSAFRVLLETARAVVLAAEFLGVSCSRVQQSASTPEPGDRGRGSRSRTIGNTAQAAGCTQNGGPPWDGGADFGVDCQRWGRAGGAFERVGGRAFAALVSAAPVGGWGGGQGTGARGAGDAGGVHSRFVGWKGGEMGPGGSNSSSSR